MQYTHFKAFRKIIAALTLIALVVGSLPIPASATTQQIRQEINIIDTALTSTGTLESSARVQLDTTKYSGTATYYFEAVIAGAASNTGTIKLARAGTTTYDASLAGATSASYTLVRSAAFTPPASTQTEYTVKLIGDGTHSQTIKSARIIVIQSSNPLTSTETQIEIGNTEMGKSNTTAAALNAPKYWKYNASNWDAGQTFYAEATYKTNASSTSETFTAAGSASWTAPAGVTSVTAETWGGGGGSGGGTSTSLPGGSGGGGGAYASKVITVTPGNSYTRVVGAAGAVSGGTAGGASTFTGDSAVQSKACGGNSGADNGGTAGAGGTTACSDGTTTFAGGNGAAGASTSGGGGGESASSAGTGHNAVGTAGGTGTAGTDGSAGQALGGQGVAGNNPGAGAGGSGRRSGGSEGGATGGVGQVKLTYNLPYPVTVTLQESDGTGDGFVGWTNKATIINAATATTATRVRSASFIPTDGRNYRIVSSVSNASGNYDVYNAKIVVDSTYGVPYDVSTATYANKSFALGAQDLSNDSLAFSPDGTIMYIGGHSTQKIYQYTLSTPFNVSTASYASKSFLLTSIYPQAIVFNSNGTKMFILGGTIVYQYSLSTAYDISTASYDSKSFTANQSNNGTGLSFNTDGTKMFIMEAGNYSVYQYSLSTAFDVSTASYASKSFSVVSQDFSPYGLSFNTDGTKMYIAGDQYDAVYQYTLSTAFDVSTASYVSKSLTIDQVSGGPYRFSFSPDGTNIFMLTLVNNSIYQYSMPNTPSITKLEPQYLLANTSLAAGTSLQNFLTKWDSTEWSGVTNTYTHVVDAADNSTSVVETDTSGGTQVSGSVVRSPDNQGPTLFEVSTASYASKSFSAGNEDTLSRSLFFNSDGTKMFVLGYNNQAVYQYTLSTPFDVSTASYASKSFSVSSQDALSVSIFFNSDGTKMFVLGNVNKTVYQYTLSTPFDVSTLSYASKSFSVNTQDTNPMAVFFDTAGTKMFIAGQNNKTVYQYTLSTPFDVSTASYASKSFSVTSQDTSPSDIFFNSDGTKMFMLGNVNASVYQYTLSTPFDVSTLSYASKSFSVSSQDISPYGLSFSLDGAKIFMVGNNHTVFQYTIPNGIMTMPSNGNLDVKATTNNNDIYADRIIVAVGPASAASYTQSNYRFYNNQNSTDVGSVFAAQNTAATLASSNDHFRLRMLVHDAGVDLSSSGQSFKLQFATKSGTCDTAFSGETYADVTAATNIAYYDNFIPVDGSALTANANDPTSGTIADQTYVESNNFTNAQTSVPAGQDAMWDFSLYDKSVSSSTSYCFRIVKADGSLLDTYSQIPEIITAPYWSRGGGGGAAGGETSATPNTPQTGGGESGGTTAGGETSGTPNGTATGGTSGGGGDTGFLFGQNYFAFVRNLLRQFFG